MSSYYPAFLEITDRSCVVIGGGQIAEGKVKHLLACAGQVTFISPKATPNLQKWASEGKLIWRKRKYQNGDLKNVFLAIAATNRIKVNRAIACEARAQRTLLNVVDNPPLCGFIAPSIVRRGKVTLAISTGGASPALARKLREKLESSEILQLAELAPLLSEARKQIKSRKLQICPDRWQSCINTDLLQLVHNGRETEALEFLLKNLSSSEEPS